MDSSIATLKCWQCLSDLAHEPLPLSRQATCQVCFEPLRCCYLCRFFDPHHRDQCLDDRAEPPLEKGNANFCEFFDPLLMSGHQKRDRNALAESSLNAMFGEDAAPSGADETAEISDAEQKLKDLFGDG